MGATKSRALVKKHGNLKHVLARFPVMYSEDDIAKLNVRDVRRRFDRAAESFDDADFVHRVTRDGLFARLEPMTIDARTVIDLGSATGTGSHMLAKRFRRARIIAVDLSRNMLFKCRTKSSWISRVSIVQANACALPFANQSVDVVASNLLLPWIDAPAAVFDEVSRVLRKDGLFTFATLGPDSLLELRRAWMVADTSAHVNRFLDMHDVGDALVRAGLKDPVLDVDRLAVSYENADALFRDLTAMGARNCLAGRNPALVGKHRFRTMTDALRAPGDGNLLALELELVYGHCWGCGAATPAGDFHIDAGNIPLRTT